MTKTYIIPETEIVQTKTEYLLTVPSKSSVEGEGGDNGGGAGGKTPGVEDPNPGSGEAPFARQNNNWMWDNLEDEY